MKKIIFTLALALGLTTQVAQAQTPKLKVGTNPTTLNSSAAFEVQSTTQGMLPPRMILNQITAIANPAEGLSVYCTDCAPKALLSFDGQNWVNANGQQPIAPPSAPAAPVATAGVGQASVAFTAPTSTGSGAIVSYTVSSIPGGRSATGTSSPIIVPNLNAGTAYTFVVRVTNASGLTATSVPSNSVTPTAGVPSAPTSLVATSTLGTTASIAFTAPTANGGTPITGYTVTSNPGNITASGTTSPIVVNGLTNGTAYTFTMVATNAQGNSVASAASNSITPQATPPGAPTIGTATISGTTASVAFTAPTNNGGGAITGYTVTSNPGGITASGTSSPISVPGLSPGFPYTFTVTASNSAGSSASSAASNSVTATGVPSAPGSVSVSALGGTSASISFTAPSANGSAITGYTVTPSPATSPATFTGTSSPITVTGLTAGTAYTFSVTATNALGTSAASTASFTPQNQVPSAPTAVSATAGDAQASITFTAPTNNGGAAITGYTVTSTPGNFTATGSGSPLTVTGLTNGTSYSFTVVATNSVGNSVASGVSNSVIPATTGTVLPAALTSSGINAAAAYSLRKINSSYNGSAIRVRRSTDNAEQNIGFTAGGDLDETALTTFVGAGNNGFVSTWYDQSGNSRNLTQSNAAQQPFIVINGAVSKQGTRAAVRYNGGNPQFLASSSLPFANSAEMTVNLVHTELARNNNAGLSFGNNGVGDVNPRLMIHMPWSDGNMYFDFGGRLSFSRTVGIGTPLLFTYTNSVQNNLQTVRYNGAGRTSANAGITNTPNLFVLGSDGTYGAAPNAHYSEYIVVASVPEVSALAALEANQMSYYGISNLAGGITGTSTPTNVVATAGNAAASVSFNTVSGATGYRVTSTPGNIEVTGTSSPVQVNGLTNGTAYTFTVKAISAGGVSAASAPSNSVTPANNAPGQTVATAPTMGTATAGNLSATVTFTAPTNNGNSAITGYTVTSNPGNITATGTSSPITVSGLTANTSYTFTVVANNAVGSSIPSAASNAVTVATLPSKPVLGTANTLGLNASIPVTVNNNGSNITSYTATITPGNITVTSTVAPFVIDFATSGTYSVTITATNAIGTSVASDALSITVAAPTNATLASTITTENSSGQAFNTNPYITSTSLVSVGTQCPSSVTWQGVSYPAVSVGGLCWMKQDFRGVPSNFASLTPTSWLNSNVGDIGSWGYANYSNTSGSSGWATSSQSGDSKEGYLYQWSAAMNGSTTERAQGVCPTGWHVPSQLEFYYIWHTLGAPIGIQYPGASYYPANISSLYTTLGIIQYKYRRADGSFVIRGYNGSWAWSSTLQSNNVQAVTVDFEQYGFFNPIRYINDGFSVRCIKD